MALDLTAVVVSAGTLSSLILEGVKAVYRTYVIKDQAYEFPPNFYKISVPLLNFLVVPGLALLGFAGYILPADWSAWGMELARLVVTVAVSTYVSLGVYEIGVKPAKQAFAAYGEKKTALAEAKKLKK